MSVNRPSLNIVSISGRFFFGLVIATMLAVLLVSRASAADYPKLNQRSLLISDVSPGVTTDYRLSWRYPSSTTIGSIRLLLCADGFIGETCESPGGDFSNATLSSQTGITGFAIASQSEGEILLTRIPGSASTVQSTYVLSDVVNPGGLQRKFYLRIQTYVSADGSGNFNHASSVVNATTEPIVITTEVPPILYFCVGITIDEWCENVVGNRIDYGDLSHAVTDVGSSQFGAATNALGGYTVTVNGHTMSAGNKLIDALSSPSVNMTGMAQFGLNLRANTDPPAGQDVTGDGIGVVAADYDIPDMFKYEDGDVVAAAATGSLFNIYTVTYIVNVDPDQPSGVYNTTIAYICTAAF